MGKTLVLRYLIDVDGSKTSQIALPNGQSQKYLRAASEVLLTEIVEQNGGVDYFGSAHPEHQTSGDPEIAMFLEIIWPMHKGQIHFLDVAPVATTQIWAFVDLSEGTPGLFQDEKRQRPFLLTKESEEKTGKFFSQLQQHYEKHGGFKLERLGMLEPSEDGTYTLFNGWVPDAKRCGISAVRTQLLHPLKLFHPWVEKIKVIVKV